LSLILNEYKINTIFEGLFWIGAYEIDFLPFFEPVLELVGYGSHGGLLGIRDGQARWVRERVIQDVRMPNADDLVRGLHVDIKGARVRSKSEKGGGRVRMHARPPCRRRPR
jgi:hypothetical protein